MGEPLILAGLGLLIALLAWRASSLEAQLIRLKRHHRAAKHALSRYEEHFERRRARVVKCRAEAEKRGLSIVEGGKR
jgi:hypothetical protein